MVDYMSSSGREYSAISGTNSQMFTEVTQDTASPYTHTGSNGAELVDETQNDEVSTEESQYETTVNDPDLTRSGRYHKTNIKKFLDLKNFNFYSYCGNINHIL